MENRESLLGLVPGEGPVLSIEVFPLPDHPRFAAAGNAERAAFVAPAPDQSALVLVLLDAENARVSCERALADDERARAQNYCGGVFGHGKPVFRLTAQCVMNGGYRLTQAVRLSNGESRTWEERSLFVRMPDDRQHCPHLDFVLDGIRFRMAWLRT